MDDRTPRWGIGPVPGRLQVLGALDSLLLWENLSASLLVIVIGALLVPALSLHTEGRIFAGPNWRPAGLIAWAGGFCLYQWLSPVGPGFWTSLVGRTHPGYVTFTASLPSFAVALTIALSVGLAAKLRSSVRPARTP